jgi:peptidoglycan hydrolase-like protein with peptidoglycan-binding domain
LDATSTSSTTPVVSIPFPSAPSSQSQGSTAANSNGGRVTISKNHHVGDISPDIKLLQQFLNTHGFIIAASGPGSHGNETSKFGALTYQALKKFQQAHELPATGYLGPLTRALLNANTQ